MPNIDSVLADLRSNTITPLLAPYQPSIPPNYVNTDPRAGTIPPTLICTGHPIQYDVTTRIENHQCQVAIYADKTDPYEQDTPYLLRHQSSNIPMLSGVPSSGIIYMESSRSIRRINIEVWAYSNESRQAIGDIIRSYLTDAFRVNHSDGQISLFRFKNQIDWDNDQIDSIYLRRFLYDCDYTTTIPYDVTAIIEATTRLTVGTAVVATAEVPNPNPNP